MLCALLLASTLAVAGDGRAETQVRAADGAVTIHAENLPLSQILDRLSSATGMTLTYEGPRPSTPVTMIVDGISETEAILKLMEGLGVSYVLRTDSTGLRVDTLIVSGGGAGRPVASSASSGSSMSSEPAYEEPVADYGQIPLDPAVIEAAGPQGKPDLNNPYLGLPAQHFPPGLPSQPQADQPGTPHGTGARSAPNMPTTPPAFPTGASYPTR